MKLVRNLLVLALTAFPLLAQDAAPEAWTVDKGHSTATFKVRHFTSNVVGQFRDFEGSINIDRANPAKSNVEFTIQAKSIDTGSERRDNHLRGADFFDVEKFPTITFKSTAVAAKSKNSFDVTGDLTMHGVTKRVTLPVTFLGFMKHPRGEKGGFEIETTLDRKDYGITWNRALDEGGFMLSEDVKVTINLEVDKKQAPAPAAAAPATK
jgi:polyisoprenoid-binding protein YceI